MLENFLSRLYPPSISGWLSLWSPEHGAKAFALPGAVTEVPNDLDSAAQDARDIYFGVCPLRTLPARGRRGGKADTGWLPALWLDVDIAGPGHRRADLPADLDIAAAVIDLAPRPPSIVVASGGGLHAYWLLEHPLMILPGETERINSLSKNFQAIIAARARERLSLHVDQTGDLARVLRLPGTRNGKYSPPRKVEVLLAEDRRYSLAELTNQSSAVLRKEVQHVSSTLSSVESQYIPTHPNTFQFLDDVRARLGHLGDPETRALAARLLAGDAFPPGERDNVMQRLASVVAFVLPDPADTLAEDLLPLFEASIAAMATAAPGAPDANNVLDKLRRALRDAASRRQGEADIRRGLDVAPAGLDDVARMAAEDGCTVEEFRRRWVIQQGGAYYVRAATGYLPPVGAESLVNLMREQLAPAIAAQAIRIDELSKNGRRTRRVLDVVAECGTVATGACASLVRSRSHFDAATGIFWEAVAAPRPLIPAPDERIGQWLELLGGADSSKLLDWLATVARLDLQTSILYLSGAHGAGKTLLAAGLARLWTTGGPALLGDVVGNFNSDLVRCPLIFGDEKVDVESTELRRLIGSSTHTLRRKFLPNVAVEGSLRLILADNSGQLLRGEEFGGGDLGAVATKFLHIRVGTPAADYLRELGGRAATADWVTGDRIARHVRWLSETRQVVLGARFAVEGRHGELARHLLLQNYATSAVCGWIARSIVDPVVSLKNGLIVGNGKVLVSAEIVEKYWNLRVSDGRPFTITKISRALKNISCGEEIVGVEKKRLHSVDPELIYLWTQENLSSDVDALKAKVNFTK